MLFDMKSIGYFLNFDTADMIRSFELIRVYESFTSKPTGSVLPIPADVCKQRVGLVSARRVLIHRSIEFVVELAVNDDYIDASHSS